MIGRFSLLDDSRNVPAARRRFAFCQVILLKRKEEEVVPCISFSELYQFDGGTKPASKTDLSLPMMVEGF